MSAPLSLERITAAGKTITLTYDQDLDEGSVPVVSDFALSDESYEVDYVFIEGPNVYLTLTTPVVNSFDVSYTPGTSPIQSLDATPITASAVSEEYFELMRIGGDEASDGNLMVNTLPDGTIVVDRYNKSLDTWSTQFYEGGSEYQLDQDYFETSSGSIIEIGTSKYALGAYLGGGEVTQLTPTDMFESSGKLVTVWSIAEKNLEIRQEVSLGEGQAVKIEWKVTNTGSSDINEWLYSRNSVMSHSGNRQISTESER